jgi:hypothetical protein
MFQANVLPSKGMAFISLLFAAQAVQGRENEGPVTRVAPADFKVSEQMPFVAFPAQPLAKGDAIVVKANRLADDEHFVLQECASADCKTARVLRVWTSHGAIGAAGQQQDTVKISHEGKYFMWMHRWPRNLPTQGAFVFREFSLPLILDLADTGAQQAASVPESEPSQVKIEASYQDGASTILHFQGGSAVLLQRISAKS